MSKNTNYLSVVQGNDFVLNINVSKRNADNAAYSPYDMSACSQVCCFLVAVTGGRRYKLPVTVNGNVLTAEIDGSLLSNGVYGLELLFEDAESHSKRSYEPALLKIVRTNAEATYTNADFDSEDECRLHITVQTNSTFVTIGAPTADTEISATSYNAVSNSAVADAITNLQMQIDSIGADILDPSSVFTKAETEALVDTMIDPQEMEEYVTNALSSYTTTEQFNSSVNDLNTRITAIEDNPTDISNLVSYDYLSQQSYLQSSALDGLATQVYVREQIEAIPQPDMSSYVSKEELSQQGYITAGDVSSMGYVTAQDVSSMGYATTQYVTEQITNIPATDLSSYVSKEELSQQGYITAGDVSSMGYITVQDVSSMGYASTQFVTEQIAAIPQPDLSSYITETELNDTLTSYAKLTDLIDNERVVSTALNSLADRIESVEGDYVSDDDLVDALNGYATESYVIEKIDALAPSDLNEYVSKQYLSEQSYLQADDISDVVRDSDLSSAGYVTTTELSSAGYVTTTELSNAGYVTTTELSSAGYVTNTDLTSAGYVTNTDLSSAGYVTTTDLTSAGYVTNTDLSSAGYVTTTDLSSAGYVTTTELSNAGYVTNTDLSSAGYVTTTNLNTVLSSYAKISDIEDNERVVSTALNTLSDRIGLIENDYVSDDELADALNGYATESYVVEKIEAIAPADISGLVSYEFLSAQSYLQSDAISDVVRDSDLVSAGYITANDISDVVRDSDLASAGYLTANDISDVVRDSDLASAGYVTTTNLNTTLADYVTESDLSNAGYLTANDISDVVRDSDLASASYVTNTALNTTLASYTTKADVPYKFVVMSYADYTALATKDPQTFYCIPEE